jgi:hypothetical protein
VVDINKVLKFYQHKYPEKNYTLNEKSIKEEPSELSKNLASLPAKGETPGKNLRKVCYRKKGGEKVFRGRFEEVQKLVNSGDYEFAPKLAWKRQILDENGNVVVKGEAYKSNINPSPDKDKPLGQRKEKRERRESEKQIKALSKLNARYRRQSQRKPGDAERKLQSEKDKKLCAERRKVEGKKPTTHRVSRAFEAVVLGDKSEVLETLSIKAKSVEHAERVARSIAKNKGKELKLTNNVRDWIKQTGKKRVSST